jgi:predicted flap endonuclease-1-like 5' DNA nuclease
VRALHGAKGDGDMAVVSSRSFTVSNEKRTAKGKLMKVQLPAGNWVKMYEADAVVQGLIDAPVAATESKARPPQENKMMPPAGDKKVVETAVSKEPATEVQETAVSAAAPGEPDDFAKSINGVGLATARLLNAHGIITFEQLRSADVSFLAPLQQQAIEDWRRNG